MSENRFVILATEGITTNLLSEELSKHGTIEIVILEQAESSLKKIKRRFRKLNFFHVVGQLFFLTLLMPFLRVGAKKRIKELIFSAGYKNLEPTSNKTFRVKSINEVAVTEIISKFKPDYIFVNGTRIISKRVLDQIDIPVLNIHVGITPNYRGIHGGYWAIYNTDSKNFGVTLHYVDAGIDTGSVIFQTRFLPSSKDNFASYPILQFIEGLKLVSQFFTTDSDKISKIEIPKDSVSKQYYHPAFFQYLFTRWFRRVK